MTIFRKLLTTFLAIALLCAAGGAIVLQQLRRIDDALHVVQEDNVAATQAMNALAQGVSTYVGAVMRFRLTGDRDILVTLKDTAERIEAAIVAYDDVITRAAAHGSETQEMVADMTETLAEVRRGVRQFEVTSGRLIAESGDVAATDRDWLAADIWDAYEALASAIKEGVDRERDELAEHMSGVDAVLNRTHLGTLVSTVVSLLLGIALAWHIARRIGSPLHRVIEGTKALAHGDSGYRLGGRDVARRDEIGMLSRAFNSMADELVTGEAARRERDAALAAERLKAEFLSTMSHEFRTPLNGIFGMTELALDTADDAERRFFISRVRSCAESLLTIVNDVLDFSKIDAGKLDLEQVDFDVDELLSTVLDTVMLEASRKGVELIGFADSALPARLRGDPGRLRQVLLNLANNAVKFTDHGEVVIRLERDADSEPADGSRVVLRASVRDTGIGIPREKQGLVFESFAQADASDTRRFGGTGLGLAIAQRLVRLMNGTITLTSERGRGSTFTFTAALGWPEAPAAATTLDANGLRVLAVDDNATNRTIVLRLLQDWGCRVAVASGGREACDILVHAARAGEPFDIVLLDMQMPDLDGIATARRLRATGLAAGVPFILLTSVSHRLPDGAAAAGITATVVKPVKRGELRAAIAAALGPSQRVGTHLAESIGRTRPLVDR